MVGCKVRVLEATWSRGPLAEAGRTESTPPIKPSQPFLSLHLERGWGRPGVSPLGSGGLRSGDLGVSREESGGLPSGVWGSSLWGLGVSPEGSGGLHSGVWGSPLWGSGGLGVSPLGISPLGVSPQGVSLSLDKKVVLI